jgi:hypothetical protein
MMRWAPSGLSLAARVLREIHMRGLLLILILLATLALGGCEVIGDIFQAGVWVGVVLVVLILAGIGFVASKLRG